MEKIELPRGFKVGAVSAGLKKNGVPDLAMILADSPCSAFGMFTQNHFPGEPVKLARERLKSGKLQALLINARYSNVATGKAGQDDAVNLCRFAGEKLSIPENLCLISSTGIIGRRYPEGKIEAALPGLIESLSNSSESMQNTARAIMTTDTVPKMRSVKVGDAVITAFAKGSGMIAPNLATMLVFILTDAELTSEECEESLRPAVNTSFNRLSVDFDTSTSDSVFLMASGKAGKVPYSEFQQALANLCVELAEDIVRDGEGVKQIIDCRVAGAKTQVMADKVGRSVINSPLIKTMITGADPNWGRVIMAIGKVEDEPGLKGCAPDITICGVTVMQKGEPLAVDLNKLSSSMRSDDRVLIEINLNLGSFKSRWWGTDLTAEYVSINADYTT